ncbi:DNA helicase [Trifolium repens]|nr:DNA helicase [Trifolium repens]
MSVPAHVTPLLQIDNTKSDWFIKVRVVRIWNVRSIIDQNKINEIQLIFIDQEGSKIQGTVPAHSIDRLGSLFYEGGVYLMGNFQVKRNVGKCMIAMNQFKLVFITNTVVIPSQSLVIPHYSLLIFSSQKIRNYENGLSHLIDVIGVVTDIKAKQSQEINAVKVTLNDKRGTCECILVGMYVDKLKTLMSGLLSDAPVLLLQFVQIKNKGDFVYVESVENITRISMNPPIVEVDLFKNEMGIIDSSYHLADKDCYSTSKPCKELEFNGLYPHKTLNDFIRTMEDGLFVLFCKVVGIFKLSQWFYPVCHCGVFLEYAGGSYYCACCHITVFSASARCKFQIGIQDATSAALLPISQTVLHGIGLLKNNSSSSALSGSVENPLIGKMLLLIAKKNRRFDDLSDNAVEVIRVTDEAGIVNQYHLTGNNYTPTKCILETPFGELTSPIIIPPVVSPVLESVGAGKLQLDENAFQKILDDSAAQYHKKYNEFKLRNNSGAFAGGFNDDASSSNMI